MHKDVVILGHPGSTLGSEIEGLLRDRSSPVSVSSLDAALEGGAVAVLPDAVIWQGVDLSRAGVVFLERPVFPWPQPLRLARLVEEGAPSRPLVAAEREALSLTISALHTAAERTRVVNRPASAHLAVAPTSAFHRLTAHEIAVHPWRLRLAPAAQDSSSHLVLDAAGRDFRHDPQRPPAGQPAWILDPVPGEVLSLLVVGERIAGALRYRDGQAWVMDRDPDLRDADTLDKEIAALAARSARILDLDFAAVCVSQDGRESRVLRVDAGPDLARWNETLKGMLSPALAEFLAAVASGRVGEGPS